MNDTEDHDEEIVTEWKKDDESKEDIHADAGSDEPSKKDIHAGVGADNTGTKVENVSSFYVGYKLFIVKF